MACKRPGVQIPSAPLQITAIISPHRRPNPLSRAADSQHNTVDYSSAVQAILLPAGVSVLVTLAVEWAAKPGLEVRKERILAQDRERRLFVQRIADLYFAAGRVLAHREAPRAFEDRLLSLVEEGLQRCADYRLSWAVVDTRDDAVDDLIIRAGPGVESALLTLLERYYKDGLAFEVLDSSSALLDLPAQYLKLPRWRIRARRRLVQRIQAEIARLEASNGLPAMDANSERRP
jgi:hypothetical protein